MVTAAELAKRVQDQYPTLAFLLGDPEIRKLLAEATDPNKGFSPNTFQWKLSQTNWWKKKSETERKWLIQKNTDPGEARRQFRQVRGGISDYAQQLGVKLNGNETKLFAEMAMQNGWAPDDRRIRQAIVKLSYQPGRLQSGAIKSAIDATRAIAKGQYFQNIPRNYGGDWGRWIGTGQRTMDDYRAWINKQAQKRHPHLADQLEAGMTLADIIDPFRQIVADELEYGGIDKVDVVSSSTWRKLLGVRDPKSGKTRLPTESDVIRMARSQTAWWNTSHGRQADAQMGTALLKKFGKVA